MIYPMVGISLLIILAVSYYSPVFGISAQVFSKDSAPYGVPYAEWITRWWQWHISLPKQGHPFITSNLENCPVGNDGQVSFVTHKIEGTSRYICNIPSGHAVLFRIASAECSTPELSPGEDPIKCATEGQQFLRFEISLDGVPLNGLEQNSVLTRFFNITIPQDNVYDIKAGTFKTIAHGYFAFIKPLSAGEHTVKINAAVHNPVDSSFDFAYQTSFLLRVQ